MLIKCPECELQVSDKALSCPHCGYPISGSVKRKRPAKGRMRLPNGFGQITEIKNKNLRKPYRAMVTVGKNEIGKPICKLLKPEAYFATYNEAYEALMNYNKNPYDLDAESITLKELYEKWTERYFKTLSSKSSQRTITAAWKYAARIHDMYVRDIRTYHIKSCILESNASEHIKSRMKSLFNLMFDYAVEFEICDKNPARAFNINNDVEIQVGKEHITFTDEEMELLWKHSDVPYVNVVLVQCYSGWRPQEIGNITLDDVDLVNWTFKGGMKTSAGKNRIVPIHPRIRHIVEDEYNKSRKLGHDKLFSCYDTTTHRGNLNLTYDKYAKRFSHIIEDVGLNKNHRPHDPRKHFITSAKKYNVDEYAIKYIVGHKITDITEAIYTEREPQWYANEIAKIK